MHKLLIQYFKHFHLGKIIGFGLFTISLYFYRSYKNKPIGGLWSYPFFVLVIISTVLFLIIVINTLRKSKKETQPTDSVNSEIIYFELAILFWGIAYFISTIDDSTNAGRITEFNFFGSIVPVAVCLEWISLAMFLIGASLFVFSFLKTKWVNIVLMFTTFLIVLLFLEGIIRFKAVIAPTTQGFPSYTSAIWKHYYVKYNWNGFRDAEHPIAKDPKTRRLLIVGNSVAFGWGIKSIKNRFGYQIGKKLTEISREHWEVINMSRGDSHTLEHIEFLKQGLIYKPDVVILLYVFNDIDYLYPITPREAPSALSLIAILFKNFYLFQEVYLRVYHIKHRYLTNNRDAFDPYTDHSLLNLHLQDISTFIKLAKQRGAFVRVVPFDIRLTLGDAFRNRYRNFINAAVASEIPVWSLEKTFNNFQYSQLVVNNFDSHPNELAHRIAAEAIAKQLFKNIYSTDTGN